MAVHLDCATLTVFWQLDRPRNRFLYDGDDIFHLAACYAHGLVTGHAFVDGNKRVSLVACMTFLDMNGIVIAAGDNATYETWMALAMGNMDIPSLARWLAEHASDLSLD